MRRIASFCVAHAARSQTAEGLARNSVSTVTRPERLVA